MERKIQPIKSKQTNLLYGLGVLGCWFHWEQNSLTRAPLRVLVCSAMARLQANEKADRDRRSLACRRSVSWYGLRLNLIKETNEAASQVSQV